MDDASATRCTELLENTFPQPPSSLEDVRRRLEQLRSTSIRVAVTDPRPLNLPTGLWVVLADGGDLVWADATLSPTHQLVTICHEFGHMLCGHQPITYTSTHRGADGPALTTAESTVAALAAVGAARPSAILERCGVHQPPDQAAARVMETEAEFVDRRLARPFLTDHQAELAALLVGQ